jgi:hypothetical protein
MSEYLANLQQAIKELHGCEAVHQSTEHVVEFFEGEKVWEGDVEVFELKGHLSSLQAFAWGFDLDGEVQYIAVLKTPPIEDPSDAVRAAIASGQF